MSRLIAVSLVFCLALSISGQVAHAATKPIWDLDYELYYGEWVPAFELWYQEPGESAKLGSTFNTYAAASNWWFFLVEHNAHAAGTVYWINETTRLKWTYVTTFEEYSDAATAAGYFQMVGFVTDIRAVFGGYDYSHLITPYQPGRNPFHDYVLGNENVTPSRIERLSEPFFRD